MECVYLSEARHLGGFKVFLRFNTGESGEVDLGEIVRRYEIAKPLRDPARFAQFHLDSWPTLTWDCGFDIAPESLYSMVTGKDEQEK
uniref:DUF2442 domain-containing protein n=1 Tax=Candidatus Kentrum sp. LPFa TaxID=2126335 RepID=A0A450XZU7_9GAMM|nr:MAG: Protein of unknown function (DUF2442) [Candidatus Kentron sp. LPFa]VFK34814.1 MAG: Protein of unknown function (DUF2442) [Candidatus Kentron sp. LPFa]